MPKIQVEFGPDSKLFRQILTAIMSGNGLTNKKVIDCRNGVYGEDVKEMVEIMISLHNADIDRTEAKLVLELS